MYRPSLAALHVRDHRPSWQEYFIRLLVPLTLWICVSVILRYDYYGNYQMVLGPSSSRLFKASSVFVKQIEVKNSDKNGIFLYGFSEKPELSLTQNWTLTNYVIVSSYSRKEFLLWLNKGSTIRIRWDARISNLGQLKVSLTKGEQKSGKMVPTSTSTPNLHGLHEPVDGKEAKYTIHEDDKYIVGIINSNTKSIMMAMNINISSKIYDTRQANSKCSTLDGSCKLSLLFPSTHFVTVTTPNAGELREWHVEISFAARVVTYAVILGIIVTTIWIILKYLGAYDSDTHDQDEQRTTREVTTTETDPLMPEKSIISPYGTLLDQDDDCASSSSSDDLYDGKVCVICYEEPRNCFFVPCGHCATCFNCAQRIIEGETRVCPICRRPIHKVRKLLIP